MGFVPPISRRFWNFPEECELNVDMCGLVVMGTLKGIYRRALAGTTQYTVSIVLVVGWYRVICLGCAVRWQSSHLSTTADPLKCQVLL